jgi:hypothetical protein
MAKAIATITAENSFTDPPIIPINMSISGTFVATVVLQRTFDGGRNWLDVESFTEPAERQISEPEPGVLYRLGVKTGGFTSGTIYVRLSNRNYPVA